MDHTRGSFRFSWSQSGPYNRMTDVNHAAQMSCYVGGPHLTDHPFFLSSLNFSHESCIAILLIFIFLGNLINDKNNCSKNTLTLIKMRRILLIILFAKDPGNIQKE